MPLASTASLLHVVASVGLPESAGAADEDLQRKVEALEQRLRKLEAGTIDAVDVLGMEDKVGGLEQGKFADFTIFEKDPMDVDPKDIENIKIWGTVLGGKPFKAQEA